MTVTPVRPAEVRADWRLDCEERSPLVAREAFSACAADVSTTVIVAVTVTDAAEMSRVTALVATPAAVATTLLMVSCLAIS